MLLAAKSQCFSMAPIKPETNGPNVVITEPTAVASGCATSSRKRAAASWWARMYFAGSSVPTGMTIVLPRAWFPYGESPAPRMSTATATRNRSTGAPCFS